MRKISTEELGTNWIYWLSGALFLSMMVGGVWLIFANDGMDRGIGIACTLIGFAFGVGSIAWPLLRKKEAQGISTEHVRTAEIHCEAVIFPASRVKYYVTTFGSLVLLLGSIGLAASADGIENRVKGAIAVAFWGSVFGLCLWSARHGRFGVIVLPEGILWREMFRAPYFVPWDILSRSGLFRKKEKNVPKPILSFGLQVSEPESVQTSKTSRKKMLNAQRQSGWHLYFFAETIAAPLPLLAAVVDFYHQNPGSRAELGSAKAFARIEEMTPAIAESPLPV
jgi:hypothetical protein